MEQEHLEHSEEQQQSPIPRPRWQVWLARVALIVFVAFLIMYYVNILRSGA